MPGECVFVSAANDNRLRVWMCASTDMYVLKERFGLQGDVTKVMFYDGFSKGSLARGLELLTGGSGLFKVSLIQDAQSIQFSDRGGKKMKGQFKLLPSNADDSNVHTSAQAQANAHVYTNSKKKKHKYVLPPIVDFDACGTRER